MLGGTAWSSSWVVASVLSSGIWPNWALIDLVDQTIGEAEAVGKQVFHAEEDAAAHDFELSVELQLVGQLVGVGPGTGGRADFVDGLTDVEMHVAACHFVDPPGDELVVGCRGETNVPVELRSQVIEPAPVNPGARIGVEVVVVGLSGLSIGAGGINCFVAPDAKRADADSDGGFALFDRAPEVLDQQVHVVAPPIAFVRELCHTVFLIGRLVREVLVANAGGIKIVVEVDGVDVVVVYHFSDAVDNEGTGSGDAWIEVEFATVAHDPIGMLACRIVGSKLVGEIVHADAVGVKPGMEFDVAAVCLLEHEGQRIVAGVLPLFTSQVLGPGPVARGIERVRHRFDLDHDGIHVHFL